MRALTAGGIESLLARHSRDVWLILMTITSTNGKLYFVNNNEAVTSNGQVFEAYPFEIIPPGDSLTAPATASVTIGNVDRKLVTTLRTISTPPTFKLDVIRYDHPDVIEMSVGNLFMRSADWTASTITATLTVDDIFNQPFPSGSGTYSPRQFPGMF